MRVAMLSYHTCPLATLGGKDTGGMNVYVRELTRQLGCNGIGADVFTRSQDEHVPHVLHDLGYGNRVVHITAGPEVPVDRELLVRYVPDFIEGIIEFAMLKGFRYDLIHSHYWLSGLAALELRKVWDASIVQMFHTLGIMKNRIARSNHEEAPPSRVETEMLLLQEADRIVAATRAELAQFQWLYKARTDHVIVIPPGVDTRHFYPIPKDEAREFVRVPCEFDMLLFVGRIEPLKGIDTLLEAIAILKRDGLWDRRPMCLSIIGGDPDVSMEDMSAEMERLQALRQKLGIGDLVTFLGRRDQAALPYYYSAAEMVVVPSHYESFGLVALEAMACGTPVVASETGGLAFLVRDGETGFHVPVGDSIALAERLQMLIEDEDLRSQLGKQAAQYAKGYAWPAITEQIAELYQSLSKVSA